MRPHQGVDRLDRYLDPRLNVEVVLRPTAVEAIPDRIAHHVRVVLHALEGLFEGRAGAQPIAQGVERGVREVTGQFDAEGFVPSRLECDPPQPSGLGEWAAGIGSAEMTQVKSRLRE